jgi:hypothetical protein
MTIAITLNGAAEGALSAVQADDRLLDALGSATPGTAGSLVDDELNALLLAWRAEVEALPFGQPVDADGVFEYTAHGAVVLAVRASTMVIDYDRAEQARAEHRLTYTHNTADELRSRTDGGA